MPTHRETAEAWANSQIKKQPEVDPIHTLQLVYILTEIALIVEPIPDLHVHIMSVGPLHYKITVTGFKYRTSYAVWGDRFLSKNTRNTYIDSVIKTFTQHSSTGYIKILRVEKLEPLVITGPEGLQQQHQQQHLPTSLYRTPNIEKTHEKLANRAKCNKWSKHVIENYNAILKPQDRPNAESVLTEIALLEGVAEELQIDIPDKIDVYAIVIAGQKTVTDDREWINMFLIERDDVYQFDAIKGCYLQDTPNGSVTIFELAKIEFKDSTTDLGQNPQPMLKPTMHPTTSGSRRIRK